MRRQLDCKGQGGRCLAHDKQGRGGVFKATKAMGDLEEEEEEDDHTEEEEDGKQCAGVMVGNEEQAVVSEG